MERLTLDELKNYRVLKAKRTRLDKKMTEERDSIKKRLESIENFVDSITEERVREAVKIYYIEPTYGEKIDWNYVADKLDSPSEDAIRKLVGRYFKKFS